MSASRLVKLQGRLPGTRLTAYECGPWVVAGKRGVGYDVYRYPLMESVAHVARLGDAQAWIDEHP